MMGLAGIEFTAAWKQRSITSFEGIKANIIGINDLIKSKKKTKRRVDIIDTESLRYILKKITAENAQTGVRIIF